MKKIISTGAFCFLTMLLFAQRGESYFGFHAAPTIDWMQSDNNLINSNGLRLGIKLGGSVDYFIDDWLVLSTGFGFAFSQGGTLLYKVGGNLLPDSELSDPRYNQGEKPLPDNTNITYILQMVELPIGLQYVLEMPNQNFDIFFSFPEITLGFIGRSTGHIKATGIELKREKIGKDVRGMNLSWGIGGGIKYGTQNGHRVSAGLFLQRGLTDVTRNDGTLVTTAADGSTSREEEDSRGTLSAIMFKFAYFL